MKARFSQNANFKDLLKRNEESIVNAALNGLEANDNFRLILSLIKAMCDKYADNSFKYIIISERDLLNLTNAADSAIEQMFTNPLFIQNRHIVIDSDFHIKDVNNDSHSNNNETRRVFTEMSKEGLVVFMLSPEGIINYFVNGRDGGESIFYASSALHSFISKKPISELQNVLEEYRKRLKLRDTYSKFFVEKSHLKSLKVDINSKLTEEQFIKANKQLLRNTPEDCFRDDLRLYLKEKLNIFFIPKEGMLENLKRLDIVMLDEDGQGLYFIEVKWVGTSIHPSGKKIGTPYDAKPRIVPDAFKQSIAYINDLLSENVNIKLGYLAVFDARNEDLPDTGKEMTIEQIPEEHRAAYCRLIKLDDFRVINEHPN